MREREGGEGENEIEGMYIEPKRKRGMKGRIGIRWIYNGFIFVGFFFKKSEFQEGKREKFKEALNHLFIFIFILGGDCTHTNHISWSCYSLRVKVLNSEWHPILSKGLSE